MQEIIDKRSQLLNYFFNQSINYSKTDILNREYAALSFSVYEEFIDVFKTEFDDVLTPIEDLETDQDEVLVKGIIIDIDMKKNYCIIHIQNKADNISITMDENVLFKYGDYLHNGDIIVVKAHTYKGKVYMHFLINYSVDDSFLAERNYLNGVSINMINEIDYNERFDLVGLVRQAKYFKSKKGNKCLRLQVYEKGKNKVYITCNNLPKNIVAGMFVSYLKSDNDAFCNNVQQIQI